MKYTKEYAEESIIIIITLRRRRRNGIPIIQIIPKRSLVGNTFAVEECPRTNVSDGTTLHNSSWQPYFHRKKMVKTNNWISIDHSCRWMVSSIRHFHITREHRWWKYVSRNALPLPNDQTILWKNRKFTLFKTEMIQSLWGRVWENTGENFKIMITNTKWLFKMNKKIKQ